MSITVVGSVALDTITTPFGKIERGLGGAATHFSVSASFFTDVNLVGVVGEDFPQEHIDFLASRHVNLTGLQVVRNGKTFHWVGGYGHDLNQAETYETHLNVFENFRPVLPDSYKNSKILFLANIDPDLQRHVIDQAGKPGLIGLDTMNLWITHKKQSLIETIKRVNIITINDAEARMLTGLPNLVQAAKRVQSWGPKTVIIKRGEYGALLFHENIIFSAPALPLERVYDPTGAGDSFAGGFFGFYDRCQDKNFESMKTAVICGSVMASFNVEKFSCDRLRTLKIEDVQARFGEFENLAKFEDMGPL